MPDISDIIKVSASITAAAPPARDFGRTMFFFPLVDDPVDEVFVAGARAAGIEGRIYTSLSDVGEDFETTHEAYKAAGIYFQQSPYPRAFVTGGWFAADANDVLIGGDDLDTVSDIETLAATETFAVNGDEPTSAPDFDGDASYADVATALQIAVRLVPA